MTNDTPAVDPFKMKCIKRAETVAKDLKKVLVEVQHPHVLGKCRDATARMYGYPDWRSLTDALGDTVSPDDADVDEEARARRHAVQIAVLERLGLKRPVAETVRARLSPTGRGGMDAKILRPVSLSMVEQYHPHRMHEAVGSVVRNSRGDAASGGLISVFDEVDDWAQDTALLPLDDMALHGDRFEDLYDHARTILDGEGRILDASTVSAKLALSDIENELYSGEWKPLPTTYIHFGTNAFPSPWPGCGIEGCYVTVVDPGELRDDRAIDVSFVVSPETAPDPGLGMGEEFTGGRFDEFVHANRHLVAGAYGDLDENGVARSVRIADVVAGLEGTEHPEEYVDAWRPYLKAPWAAAWNALRAWIEGTLPTRFGLISDLPEEIFAKMARARTEAQRARVVKEVADVGELAIQFLGEVPSTDLGGPIPEVDFPYPAVTDPEAWAKGYLEMAFGVYPSCQLHLAHKATAVLEGTSPFEHIETKALARIHEEAALSQLGRWPEALGAGRRCLKLDEGDGYGMRYRLAALLVRNEDAEGARELLARYDADCEEGPEHDWSKALLLARFGTQEQAKAAIAKATVEAPHVLDRILTGDGYPEFWYVLDMSNYVTDHYGSRARSWEAYRIAGMLRDGWAAIHDHRSLLAAGANG